MSADNHGYISLHRKIMQNFLFKEKRQFSRFEAWIYLLMSANHSDTEVLLGNQLIKVKKGSFITSEIKLMAEFQWSKSKLRAFLSLLESQSMIEKITDTKKTTLTIVKYSDYQELQTAKKPQKNREKTAKELRADTDNNENNYNNDNNDNNTSTSINIDIEVEQQAAKSQKPIRFIKPTISDIEVFTQASNLNLNPDHFFDFYESKDWMIGKNKMKDWKAAARNWARRNETPQHNKNQKPQTQLEYEKQHINSHVYKSLRGFEQSRSISAGTLKVARHYLSQTTTVIDVHEFARLLDQIENAGGIPDTVDFGTPLWLGLRESEQNDNSGHLRLSIDGTGEFDN